MIRVFKNFSSIGLGIPFLLFLGACSTVRGTDFAHKMPVSTAKNTEPASSQKQPTTVTLPATIPQESIGTTAWPTPTPNLEMMSETVRAYTSPDGQWKAEALRADPFNKQEAFVGDKDYSRVIIYRVDGSKRWTPFEEWSNIGLGDSYLDEFYWSTDGRFLYFTQSGSSDGCGSPFVTSLRRVNLQDGSLSEIPLTGLGLDIITISPDVTRMAYRTEQGILVYDLEGGESRTFLYPWPEGQDYRVGWYAWSPDGTALAFTVQKNFCGPTEAIRTSIRVMELDSGRVRILSDDDPRPLLVSGWPERDLLLVNLEGKQYFFNLDSGDLIPASAQPAK